MTAPDDDGSAGGDWRGWRRTGGWPGHELPKEAPPWWPVGEAWPPRRGYPRWRRRRRPFMGGFGCLFGFVFFVVLIGLIAAVVSVIATAGPLGDLARLVGLLVLVLAAVAFAGAGHRIRSSAASLDQLLVAAEKVEDGDYSVRVGVPTRAPRPVRDLVRGFNAMAGRLETSESQRRTLLADVSHELRTPLAVVQGNVEAILDGVHDPDREHLESILDETRVLTRLVDDLRTITESEAGRLTLHREPTDLDVLLPDAVASFGAAAASAGVTLTTDIPDDLPILDVDPVRIREVVANLVANALRHTPPGGRITVAGCVEGGDGSGRVVVSVADTGGGIDPELQAHVFDRFAKSADSRGSGLGLAIARGLVEAHGGTISVESRLGEGATFRVVLPLATGDGRSLA
ncbi:MAG: ATP-binding protein [Chloroflexota bacterium]